MYSSTTHAVILAAGEGSRVGGVSKGRLASQGVPLIAVAVQRCIEADLDDILVVIGAQAEVLRPLIPEAPSVRVVEHPDWRLGRTSSLQAGLADIFPVGRILIFPVDVALISPDTIPVLLLAANGHPDAQRTRWTPVCDGARGHPILFTADLIPELLALYPDEDPKPIFRAATDIPVHVDDPMVNQGIKTPEDVLRFGLGMPDD